LKKVQDFVVRFSTNKTKIVPWRIQALKVAMQQHMGVKLVYLPKRAQVIAVPGFGNEGGYKEIHKVHTSRMVNTSTIIDFARKMSKATKEVDK
jgi:hypothetical protein